MKNLLVVILVSVLQTIVLAQDANTDTVRKLVQKMMQATVDGDYNTVLDMTHPKVLNMMGGKEAALKTVNEQLKKLKESGLQFEMKEVGTPTFAKADQEIYSATSIGMVMKGLGKKVTVSSAIVGISEDRGKTWKFINMDATGEAGVRKFLPNLPKDFKLPKHEQKVE
jgi:hypothetical protein